MLTGLSRFIATPETAKHRFFVFLDTAILPDNMLVNIALDDAHYLGVLSSRLHVTWTLGSRRYAARNRPRYNKTRCFEPFPFPDATDAEKARIRAIAEELDAHRKRQQAQHPKLTLTDMYNVLEKLRGGRGAVEGGEGHARAGAGLRAAAAPRRPGRGGFDAYGWPATLSDEEILARLVALNAERAAEEARGLVRWLRPEYQAPQEAGAVQLAAAELAGEAEEGEGAAPRALRPWPDGLAEQAAAVRAALVELGRPVTPGEVAAAFDAAPGAWVGEWLGALAALGQARVGDDGRYVTA